MQFHGGYRTANILKKPLSQEEFVKMWSHIESPVRALKGNAVFDRIAKLSDAQVIYNRYLLGDICELVERLSYIHANPLFSEKEFLYILMRNVRFLREEWTERENYFLKELFNFAEDFSDFSKVLGEQEQFEEVFEKFLILFENENLVWIDYLVQAGQMEPYNKEVVQYLIAYAEAIEDREMLNEYVQRLEKIESELL